MSNKVPTSVEPVEKFVGAVRSEGLGPNVNSGFRATWPEGPSRKPTVVLQLIAEAAHHLDSLVSSVQRLNDGHPIRDLARQMGDLLVERSVPRKMGGETQVQRTTMAALFL